MGVFRRIAGFLGFKDDGHEPKDEDDDNSNNHGSDSLAPDRAHFQETGAPRRGFGVPVQVVVDRPQFGPVLVPCNPGDGGVQVGNTKQEDQGLRWYATRLKIDEDGDIADEFLNEVMEVTPTNIEDHQRPFPRFEVKSTRPAKVKSLVLSLEGKIQCVEHQGRLQWV